MAFCGQCGLLIASGNKVCPRCGTVTEPELNLETHRANDPTLISLSNPTTRSSPGPVIPPQQEKLVLRPDGQTPDLKAYVQAPNDPTNFMATPSAIPPIPQRNDSSTPYHGFVPAADMYNQAAPQQYGSWASNVAAPSRPKRRGRGRVIALLAVLAVLLVALGGVVALVMNPALLRGIIGKNSATPGLTATATTDQARGLILRYYDDINKRNYLHAYNLWAVDPQHPPQSYDNFASGYAHTLHDDVVFNSVTLLADGNVQLDVTLTATEERTSGAQQSTYHLRYLVGQQGGTWKILNGHAIVMYQFSKTCYNMCHE